MENIRKKEEEDDEDDDDDDDDDDDNDDDEENRYPLQSQQDKGKKKKKKKHDKDSYLLGNSQEVTLRMTFDNVDAIKEKTLANSLIATKEEVYFKKRDSKGNLSAAVPTEANVLLSSKTNTKT
ncbi:hypothetical protein RFI_33007 [Reticulomyxa filosa]|uniref:Uncharacterized protein n=1 Tax=Reticulomyxa filosa TaxID=46433 RepID=X6LS01_RETFI|nr:hypothetical protein RFI_33007 [Reticulomyxa filosa]|eukprot:ETO04389.1 hypothetical protein RFI_33007 [Reticulomyxa filosa]